MANITLIFLSLLCLGVPVLSQPSTREAENVTHAGTLPEPVLWAEPGPINIYETRVTLWCQSSSEVDRYHLEKMEENGQWLNHRTVNKTGKEAKLIILVVRTSTAGFYRCLYQKQSILSKPSKPLELVVTGIYRKPSFQPLSSLKVREGQNVTFQCVSHIWLDSFVLYKEGEDITSNVSKHQEREREIKFSLFAVTAANGGSYRCYTFSQKTSHIWSAPSDPLILKIIDPASQHYTLVNLIRFSLAGLVLLILGVLLVEAWHSWKRTGADASEKQADRVGS